MMGKSKRLSSGMDNGASFGIQPNSQPKVKKMKLTEIPKGKKVQKKKQAKKQAGAGAAIPVAKEKDAKVTVNRSGRRDTSSSSSGSDSGKNSGKIAKSGSDSNSNSGSGNESNSSDGESSREQAPAVARLQQNAIPHAASAAKSYNPAPKSSSEESYHSDTEEEDKRRRKKQKELLKQQLSKKTNKPTNKKKQVRDSEDSDGSDGETVRYSGAMEWTLTDINNLVRRMELQVSPSDEEPYDKRAKALNWKEVSFGDYNGHQCCDMWTHISKRLRKHRNLSEMLLDAKRQVETLSSWGLKVAKGISGKVSDSGSGEGKMQKAKSDEGRPATEKSTATKDKTTGAQGKASKGGGSAEPKKPSPPFKFYLQDQLDKKLRDGLGKKSIEESAKESWKNLSIEKKMVWIKRSMEDSDRFEKELESLKHKYPHLQVQNVKKSVLNKEERSIIERLSGKPLKPPTSAYSLFSKRMLQSNEVVKSKPPKERMAEISKRWKELPQKIKSEYEQEVKESQRIYQVNFQNYLETLSPERREREKENNKKGKKKEVGADPAKPEGTAGKRRVKTEPKAPPVSSFDIFIDKFLKKLPPGVSEREGLRLGSEEWGKLPQAKKLRYEKELQLKKEAYILKYEAYLKGLPNDKLKEMSRRRQQEQQEQAQRLNGRLSDSNDESDKEKSKPSNKKEEEEEDDDDEEEDDDDDDEEEEDDDGPAGGVSDSNDSNSNKSDQEGSDSEGSGSEEPDD